MTVTLRLNVLGQYIKTLRENLTRIVTSQVGAVN